MIEYQQPLGVQDYKAIRTYAFQFVYQQDVNQHFFLHEGTFRLFVAQHNIPLPYQSFLKSFLEGLFGAISSIDDIISQHSLNWKLYRMAKVDLSILRVAVWELKQRMDTDTAVIVSEAIKLAKEYGSSHSVSFVNGILDPMAKTLRSTKTA